MNLDSKIENVKALLQKIAAEHTPAVFASSFGAEDMVLVDLICKHARDIEIFTLDTGRLPEETYHLMQEARNHYAVPIRIYFPQSAAVEKYVLEYGPNAFYESVDLRKSCCYMRKVEPLRRALQGKQAWITGMRRDQAITRAELALSEWDAENKINKFNPLYDWTQNEVWSYIRRFEVPCNALHDKGYPSIGCAPCTRAITAGEDIRAGRWWWENPSGKECGLHPKKPKIAVSVN